MGFDFHLGMALKIFCTAQKVRETVLFSVFISADRQTNEQTNRQTDKQTNELNTKIYLV